MKDVSVFYNLEDICNADEAGIKYCMPPDRTISKIPRSKRKRDEVRMTYRGVS